VEIRPGNKRIVHHAIVHVESTSSSRGLDFKDGQPGYDGMVVSPAVHSPDGHFLSWLPGLIPFSEDPEMSWRLDPGTEFVVETHMLPSGKPEAIQISVGIYFADAPPKKFPVPLLLHSEEIDIPAGEPNYEVVDSYTLPIAVELLGMNPHAHLLGKEFEVWATLPDGTKNNLLSIPHWDFAWQNAYRFKRPVAVPAGTTLSMRIRFDNSENNIRNPHHPPQRVHFGFQSYDEMAQLTFQVLPRDAAQARKLAADFQKRELASMIKGYEYRLKFDSDDARLQTDLGGALLAAGREEDALEHLQKGVQLQPHYAPAHYNLGLVHTKLNKLFEAKSEFEAAIRDDPEYYLAQSDLGLWHLQKGNLVTAKKYFIRSLKIHPQDAVTHNNLGIVLFEQGNLEEAGQQIREALRVDPNYGPARDNLRKLEAIRSN
jgi:tetratricopeptide (TPR) repeat protein